MNLYIFPFAACLCSGLDQPDVGETLLRHLRTSNSDILKDLSLDVPAALVNASESEAAAVSGGGSGADGAAGADDGSKTMTGIEAVDMGISQPDAASGVFSLVVDALRNQTDRPVLFAVDDFNHFFDRSSFGDPEQPERTHVFLPARRLRLVDTFLRLAAAEAPPARGAVVLADSYRSKETLDFDDEAYHAARRRLHPVGVTPFSRDEVEELLNLHADADMIFTEITPQAVATVRLLSGGRGGELARVIRTW